MKVGLIVYAIPAFLILIFVELAIARFKGRAVYRTNDALNDIACGSLQILLGPIFKIVTVGLYIVAYEKLSLGWFPRDLGVWTWLLAFLGVDFCYYWLHRLSHERNVLWAGHVVHHQSEEYNLAVALRQSAVHGLFSWVFYIPLAILGMPPLTHFLMRGVNTLYQFWIHTRLIGKLGPVGWIFNTPSHHRVHHARDVAYIDRNHGGTLIVWDRLFGTFVAEKSEPRYGTTKALASWNPIWANLEPWGRLWRLGRSLPRWQDKLALLFRPPAWTPEGAHLAEAEEAPDRPMYDADAPPAIRRYIVAHFALVLVGTTLGLAFEDALGLGLIGVVAAGMAGSLVSLGGLFEGRRWAPLTEFLRIVLMGMVAGFMLWPLAYGVLWTSAVALVALVLLLVWLSLLAEHRGHFLPTAEARAASRTRMRLASFDEVLR